MPPAVIRIQPDHRAPVAVDIQFTDDGLGIVLDIGAAELLHRELGRLLQTRPRYEGLKLRSRQLVEKGVISRREYEAAFGPSDLWLPAVECSDIGDVVKVPMAAANETPAPNELDEDATAWFQRTMGLD